MMAGLETEGCMFRSRHCKPPVRATRGAEGFRAVLKGPGRIGLLLGQAAISAAVAQWPNPSPQPDSAKHHIAPGRGCGAVQVNVMALGRHAVPRNCVESNLRGPVWMTSMVTSSGMWPLFNQLADKVKVRLGGRRKAKLDFL